LLLSYPSRTGSEPAAVEPRMTQASPKGGQRAPSSPFSWPFGRTPSGLARHGKRLLETRQDKPVKEHQWTPEGSQFWQEVFSAASMVLPSLYALCFANRFAEGAAFPSGVWALVYMTYAHCFASVAFHATLAIEEGKVDPFQSPFRLVDLGAIHTACVVFGWAVSHGALLFTVASAVLNLGLVLRLFWRYLCGLPGNSTDTQLLGVCIVIYTAPMLLRGDVWNYVGAVLCMSVGFVFFYLDARLNGWGHGVFHVMLLPYFHFLLCSAAAR